MGSRGADRRGLLPQTPQLRVSLYFGLDMSLGSATSQATAADSIPQA